METIIHPNKQRSEILFFLCATVVILLVAGVLIALTKREKEPPKLKRHQISAFSSLSGNDQGLFSDLYTAALEIEALHRDNGEVWPSVDQLKSRDVALPPFTEDYTWNNRGKLKWRLFTYDRDNVHRSVYVGRSSDENIAGNFLLLFEHFHTMDGAYYIGVNTERPYTIWFNKDWSLPADISEGTLIQNGWREAVPYSGKEELKRLNRG